MYKQPGTPDSELLRVMGMLNNSLKDNSNVIWLRDLNINVSKPNHPLKELFQVTGAQNIIVSAPTCYKNPDNPSITDLVVTNVSKRLRAATCIDRVLVIYI